MLQFSINIYTDYWISNVSVVNAIYIFIEFSSNILLDDFSTKRGEDELKQNCDPAEYLGSR